MANHEPRRELCVEVVGRVAEDFTSGIDQLPRLGQEIILRRRYAFGRGGKQKQQLTSNADPLVLIQLFQRRRDRPLDV